MLGLSGLWLKTSCRQADNKTDIPARMEMDKGDRFMEDKSLSLADTFNMKNYSDRAALDQLLATVADVRNDLLMLKSELGEGSAAAKLEGILQRLEM